jgi:16S rRNA (guanine527-N7)-methyltransferase
MPRAQQEAHFDKRLPTLFELGFKEDRVPHLKRYLELLRSSNEELNLISRKMTFEELIDNHVIDCLLPISKFPTDVMTVADFGSGGGLPGVLFAIQFPHVQFHLFEKSPKKCEFLERCREIAPNLHVEGEIAKDLQKFELVTSRAFKPVDVILEMSRDYYKKGGRYFLLKGRREKIDEETLAAKKKFDDLTVRIETLHSPVLEVERHLVLIH